MATSNALSCSLGEFLTARVIGANPLRNRHTPVSTGRVPKSCTRRVLLEAPNQGSRPLSGRRSIIKQCLRLRRGVDISDCEGDRVNVIGRPPAPVHIAAGLRPAQKAITRAGREGQFSKDLSLRTNLAGFFGYAD